MSKKFAIVKGNIVDVVTIADSPLPIDGLWVDLTGISPEPGPQWNYEDGVFTPPPPPPPPPKILSKRAFRYRFTNSEWKDILTAAKTDVDVELWYGDYNLLNSFDLDDQTTKDGINLLVAKNILTLSRGNEILNSVITIEERQQI